MKMAKAEDWKTEGLPAKQSTIALNRLFSAKEMTAIRLGLVPQQMEDKWFIYWQDEALFFHRSWTGICIYAVHFAAEGDNYRMDKADVNRDPEQYSEVSDERDAAMISYLVDVLLLRRNAEFSSGDLSPEEQALRKWSLIGRASLGQHPTE